MEDIEEFEEDNTGNVGIDAFYPGGVFCRAEIACTVGYKLKPFTVAVRLNKLSEKPESDIQFGTITYIFRLR